jgi:hypothetical protein
MDLSTASVAVRSNRLLAPKKPLAILNIFLLFFLAVTALFTLGIFLVSCCDNFIGSARIRLFIGNQLLDLPFVGFIENGRFSQVSLPFPCLGGQDVAGVSLASFDSAGSRQTETLRRTPVRFDFWHGLSPFIKN